MFHNCNNLKILLITAHPDDESMFFAPTVLNLSPNHIFYVLCLSTGNYYKIGYKREEEFKKSCNILGVDENRAFIINNENLKDNPELVWNSTIVSDVVKGYTIKYQINVLITFDDYGVSGHLNHIAIHLGVRRLMRVYKIPGLSLFELKSVTVFRKYLSFVDVLCTMTCAELAFFCSFKQFKKALGAMLAHSSQMTWYRFLYIMFSRYMLVNELVPISF
ncbi:hypothetical protein HELRODRAFT_116956 [Helobdella robusta]|uniref:N-acetylglucosaminylphosphatidylinositol deacetylase n=1 Tax=Helobdella robusta TaxID=6412 RepID=T1EGI8_HELRO|nr:hypothetical protein HELRODRAFT_116956 [Helobdella robusta]ESO10476.1 hypothetical protein HELRODRAFT_116956 [Helobdella robusta]